MPKTNFQSYHQYDTYCPPYINYSLLPTPDSLMIKIAQDQY
ncbi:MULTISPECIES: hypothetical protein [Moorena]|nr:MULTISPECIES: hypothetical protein [Moorena]